ncbi:MAG: PH domain-containing protein [Methanoregulaceae archaeon]
MNPRSRDGCAAPCYLGHNVSYEDIEAAFPKFIRDDTLLCAFSGRIYPGTGTKTADRETGVRLIDYLLITQNHVVFWGRGLYGQTIEVIPYEQILDVTVSQYVIFGEISLTVPAGQKRFGDMNPNDVMTAAEIIRTRISCAKKTHPYQGQGHEPVPDTHLLCKFHSAISHSSGDSFQVFPNSC